MPSLPRLLTALALCGLLAPAALAAPAPEADPAGALELALPPDADQILVLNVKTALASPAVKEKLRPTLEAILGKPAVKALVAASGIDPLKDIDRVVVAGGRSSYGPKGDTPGPLFIVLGRLDAGRLAKASKSPAPKPSRGARAVFEIPTGAAPLHATLPAPGLLILSPVKAQAVAAGERVARSGKRAEFKYREVPTLLKGIKPEMALAGFLLESGTLSQTHSATLGPGGQQDAKVTHHTLGETGVGRAEVVFTLRDGLAGKLTLTGKEGEDFAPTILKVNAGFEQMRNLLKMVGTEEPLASLALVLGGVVVKDDRKSMTFDAQADGDTLGKWLEALSAALGR